MVRVVGVRFKAAGKVYYFDPAEFSIDMGDHVVVETARGVEYGEVAVGTREVAEEQVVQPLKKVLRLGTEKDAVLSGENKRKETEAFGVAQKKIEAHGLEMSLVDVEYTFDGSKIIFYFTAEGRVDFRELVRDLAGVFRTRIEMRQIGVRDEAKLLGGIGPCGRVLCCTSFLGDFAPVSIRMAKDQNLSLNPSKISGLCGRLMCCLRYEQDTYDAAKKDPTLAPGYVPPVVMAERDLPELVELEDRPTPPIRAWSESETGAGARIATAAPERPRSRDERPTERRSEGSRSEGPRSEWQGAGERRERTKQKQAQQGQPRPQGEGGKRRETEPRAPGEKGMVGPAAPSGQGGQPSGIQNREKQRGGQPRTQHPQGGQPRQERPAENEKRIDGERTHGERSHGERPLDERPQGEGRGRRQGRQGPAPAGQPGASLAPGQPTQGQAPGGVNTGRPPGGEQRRSAPLPAATRSEEAAVVAADGAPASHHRHRRHRRRHGGGGGNSAGGPEPQGGGDSES